MHGYNNPSFKQYSKTCFAMIYSLVVRQTVIRVEVISVAVIGVVLNLLIFIFRRIAEIVDKHMLGIMNIYK